eukprot:PhF_6_TR6901/c0_g1_i1/m.10016
MINGAELVSWNGVTLQRCDPVAAYAPAVKIFGPTNFTTLSDVVIGTLKGGSCINVSSYDPPQKMFQPLVEMNAVTLVGCANRNTNIRKAKISSQNYVTEKYFISKTVSVTTTSFVPNTSFVPKMPVPQQVFQTDNSSGVVTGSNTSTPTTLIKGKTTYVPVIISVCVALVVCISFCVFCKCYYKKLCLGKKSDDEEERIDCNEVVSTPPQSTSKTSLDNEVLGDQTLEKLNKKECNADANSPLERVLIPKSHVRPDVEL